MYCLLEKIKAFVTKHGNALSDVVFQCDSNCGRFAKDGGLNHKDADDAHMLADIVAWANNKNKEPAGAISMDLKKAIEEKPKQKLK